MMNELIELLIPIVAILSTIALPITLGVVFALKSEKQKHIERMELIKQGLIPPTKDEGTSNRLKSLKNAVVLVGLGLGLIVGLIIVKTTNVSDGNAFWVVGPSVLIFLGVAQLVYFFLSKRAVETEED